MSARRRIGQFSLTAVVVAACVACAGGTTPSAGPPASSAAPRTLVSLDVPIAEFAQDGERLAWMTGRCTDIYGRGRLDSVAVRAASGGKTSVVASKVCGGSPISSSSRGTGLALAGTRALFWWPVEGANCDYYRIATAAVEDTQVRTLGGFSECGEVSIGNVSGAGGDGRTLAYAVLSEEMANDCVSEPVACVYRVSNATSGVWRVAGGRAVPIRGVPAAAALDVSTDEIAVEPAKARAVVQIRDARTGALRTQFAPGGKRIDELALAGDSAAVLVSAGSGLRIERYAATSGRLIEAGRVPGTAQDIDVAGANVVYRVGNEIWVFTGGRTRIVAHAAAVPIGLSIEGRRVAWAENVSGRGRIRSVTLP